MARDKRDTYESYDKDIFDNPPAGPIGVHQGNRSFWSRLLPYLVVILVAVAAGLLVWGLYSGELSHVKLPWSQSSSTSQEAHKTTEKSESSKNSAKKEHSKDDAKQDSAHTDDSSQSAETNNAAPQPAPAPQPNKQVAVRIINGTQISGYAAGKQSVLSQAGYSNTSAGNLSGSRPASSVVWYDNEADKATADDVASVLGISTVVQQSGTSAPVTVVLLN